MINHCRRAPAWLHPLLHLFVLIGCLLGVSLAHGQAPVRAAEVNAASDELDLGPVMDLLEDTSGQMTLEQVRAPAQPWEPHFGRSLSPGLSHSAWWARVRLRNVGSQAMGGYVVDTAEALQDYVDFYVATPGGKVISQAHTGDRRPFAARPIATRAPAMPLAIAPGETVEIYLRLGTHDGLHEVMVPKLWSAQAYARATQTETLGFGLYYGVMVAMLLYNAFLFASARLPAFGYYVAYVLAFLIWGFSFRGYAFQYFWPQSPSFNNQMLPIITAACHWTFALFLVRYLDMRRQGPRWLHRAVVLTILANMLCMVPPLFGLYAWSFKLSIPCSAVTSLLGLVAGWIFVVRLRSRPARYFLIAFAVLGIGVWLYYMRVLGLLPPSFWTEGMLQVGSALEVLLLGFGLADQMNTLKAEKLDAEHRALEAQTALAHELEALVRERTGALEDANKRLADMAITDELTGAFNRRHFNAVFEQELARRSRQRTTLALCLFDVDLFKAYNDRYGHQAGDLALQRVAATVRDHLRRTGDQLFRLGGEEFGVLLVIEEPHEHVPTFIERIRAGIEAMSIQHAMSGDGVLTASFGLVMLGGDSGLTRPQEIYALADELLYAAKNQGRNRVVWRAT